MQITCPSCEAAYAVPDEKIAGRVVKCARCGHKWTPVPAPLPEPAPMTAAIAAYDFTASRSDPDEPVSVTPAAPARPPRDRPLLAAWLVSVVLLIGIAVAAYFARDQIMQAWPPSQRLYAALGLR
jgi:predicted Zn finger-like uncharacterized protein